MENEEIQKTSKYNLRPRHKVNVQLKYEESPTKKRRIEKAKRNMVKRSDRRMTKRNDIEFAYDKKKELVSTDIGEEEVSVSTYLRWNSNMTVSEFLRLPLPLLPVKTEVKNDLAYTERAHPRSPKVVKYWEGFLDAVSNHTSLYNIDAKMPEFFGIDPTFVLETEIPDVQGKLRDVSYYMQKIFTVLSKHISLSGSMPPDFIGQPDFYLVSEGIALSFIEAKSPYVLPQDKNINDDKEQKRCWTIIRQIYGYLAYNNLRYGILSSYNITYFLYRPKSGELYISPGILANSTNPTLLQCLFYWCEVVLKDEELKVDASIDTPTNSRTDNDEEGEDEDKGDEFDEEYKPSPNSESTSSDEIIYQLRHGKRYLGRGSSGKVFAVENIAIKVVDMNNNPVGEKYLQKEVIVYNKLSTLKLSFIPKFYFSKFHFGFHFMGIELINGRPCKEEEFSSLGRTLSERLQILKKYGVEHCDVRKENIIMINGGSDFKIIDFGICKVTNIY